MLSKTEAAYNASKKKNAMLCGIGLVIGIINGLFASGGGLLLVPLLEKLDIPPQKAHAAALCITVPLSVVTLVLLLLQRVSADWNLLYTVLPTGLLGAVIGSFALKKLPDFWLHKLFAGVMIFAAVRMLLRVGGCV